ncbi:hypothetical protein [Streptomyces sp. NPDC006879]|uniref:hypothetical protein n=1 Tax=Streptomyces sp. NPDC006879 TaxID=3364767 RepID=UPI0036CD3176
MRGIRWSSHRRLLGVLGICCASGLLAPAAAALSPGDLIAPPSATAGAPATTVPPSAHAQPRTATAASTDEDATTGAGPEEHVPEGAALLEGVNAQAPEHVRATVAPPGSPPPASPVAEGPARGPATGSHATAGTTGRERPSTQTDPAATPDTADLSASGALRTDGRLLRDSGGATSRAPGPTFDYAVTVTNHGPSDARQVTATDRLPAALEFVSSPDGCRATGRTVTCGPLTTLAAGRSHTWLITVRLAAGYGGDGSDIVNEAVVEADTADPDPDNNTTTLTGLEVPPEVRTADLSLTKTAVLTSGRKGVTPGEEFEYRITVVNHGPAQARTVQVSDHLPSRLSFVSSPDGCAATPAQDNTVLCPIREQLDVEATVRYRIVVKVKANGGSRAAGGSCTPIDNIAQVRARTDDPDLSDNANAPGTTGPGGGPLCLVAEPDGHRPDHHGKHPDAHEQGRDHASGAGRGQLADSGAGVPAWSWWVSGLLVAGGAGLRTALRRRT